MNVSDQINWSADQLKYQINTSLQDSTVKSAIDSLNGSIEFFKLSVKEAPEKIDSLVHDIQLRIDRIVSRLDNSVKTSIEKSFNDFSKEREEITKYISTERETIMLEGKVMLDDSIAQLMDGVSTMIKKLLVYIILFVFLIVGVPFYIGYRIGNRKNKKEPK